MADSADLVWWQKGVVYQIYPRSFQDTTGNGVGDLAGIIARLDYVADLGIDAVWLSPFYPSPMADFGYDVSDYENVHPLFGDLETFDRLVTEAHRRDIRVIVDFVPNHTSDQHPWFIESRVSRDSARRNWYVWADPRPGEGNAGEGRPPNNWLSVFGGPAWEWDETTGQYYLHSFLKEQPDLNWRNPAVKEAMFDALRFWLARGVDGFRIDVAHYIMKDPEMRDNPVEPNPKRWLNRPIREYDKQVHVHDKGHPDVHGVFRELRHLLNMYGAGGKWLRFSVGEIHIFDWDEWATYYGAELDELHMPFNFALLNVAWHAQEVRRVVDSLEAAIPQGAWPNYVLGNHDIGRIATRYGQAQARIAAMLLLTLRGTPTLYYGDELGMENGIIPPDKIQDPPGITLGAAFSRDVCRTPMQWDTAAHAGFTVASVDPWLPTSVDHATRNVAAQSREPASMLALYRHLLALRRGSPALHGGSYHPLDRVPDGCYAYLREAGDERKVVVLNFTTAEQTVSLPGVGNAGRVALSTHLDREGAVDPQHLQLRPDEGCIVDVT